jgi:hypothetical protein
MVKPVRMGDVVDFLVHTATGQTPAVRTGPEAYH